MVLQKYVKLDELLPGLLLREAVLCFSGGVDRDVAQPLGRRGGAYRRRASDVFPGRCKVERKRLKRPPLQRDLPLKLPTVRSIVSHSGVLGLGFGFWSLEFGY